MVRGEAKPGERWTYHDQVVALSLTAYERGLCQGCGQPLALTTGEHPTNYEIHTYECRGCSELEIFTKELEPGERTYLLPEDD